MNVSALELIVALVAIFLGSLVQGSIGFGLGILGAPLLALSVPAALPASLVLVAFPHTIASLVREHHAIDRRTLPWMLLGAVPGTLIGLLIVTQFEGPDIAIVVGSITLFGVGLSLISASIPIKPTTSAGTGFISNVFGTASGVGGPPVALLLQRHPGPATRSTLGAFFAVSGGLSLIGYVITGTISVNQVIFSLELLPALIAGFWLSRHTHIFIDRGWLRPAMLILSAVAGAAALIRGLS